MPRHNDTVSEQPTVVAVSRDAEHRFSKANEPQIVLIAGVGVEGDAHAAVTVQHRSRVAADPAQLNLRQVHLLHAELHDELNAKGYDVGPGQLGENVTTRGVDLLGLPRGTRLHLGDDAVVEVTGLRNPCRQINTFRRGLMKVLLQRGADGQVRRKAGIMAVVVRGGLVRPGGSIGIVLPSEPHSALEPV